PAAGPSRAHGAEPRAAPHRHRTRDPLQPGHRAGDTALPPGDDVRALRRRLRRRELRRPPLSAPSGHRSSGPDPLARLVAEPRRAGLSVDMDGTLAPIVDDPADAAVPEPTRSELRRLAGRYALVACVSGRPEDEARAIVGVPELRYVGEHGLGLSPEA